MHAHGVSAPDVIRTVVQKQRLRGFNAQSVGRIQIDFRLRLHLVELVRKRDVVEVVQKSRSAPQFFPQDSRQVRQDRCSKARTSQLPDPVEDSLVVMIPKLDFSTDKVWQPRFLKSGANDLAPIFGGLAQSGVVADAVGPEDGHEIRHRQAGCLGDATPARFIRVEAEDAAEIENYRAKHVWDAGHPED